MSMATEYRHEYKYLCSAQQLVTERKRLERLLRADAHVGADGSYRIRSVYFDTPGNDCYYENEDGVDRRSKYRVRIYNCSDDRIRLERKTKCHGMTHKDACAITRGQCDALLKGHIPAVTEGMPPALAKMLTELRLRCMRPAVIVQYDRVPYVHPIGNVRVTLDLAISSSQQFDRFFDPALPARPILASGQGVLEVKWDQLLPSYLKEQLQLEGLRWTSFSKYYLCRKYNQHGGLVR